MRLSASGIIGCVPCVMTVSAIPFEQIAQSSCLPFVIPEIYARVFRSKSRVRGLCVASSKVTYDELVVDPLSEKMCLDEHSSYDCSLVNERT